MPEAGAAEITLRPVSGRVFTTGRRVRLADVDPTSRCRLDALVRHLQDVARDDSADSNLSDPMNWVVRRTMLEVHRPPVFEEWLDIATWCSGAGARWAERRTEIRGDRGAHVEASTVWVFVDAATGRPAKLPVDFLHIWGETAGDRRISARTTLPTVRPDDVVVDVWPVRFADLDVLGHVNNALGGAMAEEAVAALATRGDGRPRRPVRAELEYRSAIDPDDAVEVLAAPVGDQVRVWVVRSGAGGPGDALPGDAVPITAVVTTA